MSKSEEFETEEDTLVKGIDEKGPIQNNALLYLILKEGYKITVQTSKQTKPPKEPKSLQKEKKSNQKKTKKGYQYKCIEIINEEDEELLTKEEIEAIGHEMNEIIQIKIKQKESSQSSQSFSKEKDVITIEPKDIFTDGVGNERE